MQARSIKPLRCGCAALGSAVVMTQTASGACAGTDVGAGAISGVLMVARGACSTRKFYTTAQPLDVCQRPVRSQETGRGIRTLRCSLDVQHICTHLARHAARADADGALAERGAHNWAAPGS